MYAPVGIVVGIGLYVCTDILSANWNTDDALKYNILCPCLTCLMASITELLSAVLANQSVELIIRIGQADMMVMYIIFNSSFCILELYALLFMSPALLSNGSLLYNEFAAFIFNGLFFTHYSEGKFRIHRFCR